MAPEDKTLPLAGTALSEAELDENDPERARPLGVDAWRAEADVAKPEETAEEEATDREPQASEDDDGADEPGETTEEITGSDAPPRRRPSATRATGRASSART